MGAGQPAAAQRAADVVQLQLRRLPVHDKHLEHGADNHDTNIQRDVREHEGRAAQVPAGGGGPKYAAM